ncbi:acyltransferase [Luteimicrobium sp. NPDC057192]|uniref:acyltransferase n=1 Tax=Luteimicrobium sp. NPDC057192 TaxID=3346042 RepID=UPI0036430617
MPTTLESLAPWSDDRGNRVEFEGTLPADARIKVVFRGSGNVLRVDAKARLAHLSVTFDCDGGTCEIGSSAGVPPFRAIVRVGQDSTVVVGQNVSSTGNVVISAVEGTTVTIGDDVMFATGNQVRADDGHPIFDVTSGKRVNRSRSITVGSHVWLAFDAALLAGAQVGDGAVVGFRSVVKGRIPNNCIAVGAPARVVRRDIAWERPHLSVARPYYKPDASTVKKSEAYWNLTEDPAEQADGGTPAVRSVRPGVRSRVRRVLGR